MTERIFDVRYTSPSDAESSFSYETIKRETELKTGVFTFPSKDGAHVQHQGIGAKSFPLTCIFSGSDCMDDADALYPSNNPVQHFTFQGSKACQSAREEARGA